MSVPALSTSAQATALSALRRLIEIMHEDAAHPAHSALALWRKYISLTDEMNSIASEIKDEKLREIAIEAIEKERADEIEEFASEHGITISNDDKEKVKKLADLEARRRNIYRYILSTETYVLPSFYNAVINIARYGETTEQQLAQQVIDWVESSADPDIPGDDYYAFTKLIRKLAEHLHQSGQRGDQP